MRLSWFAGSSLSLLALAAGCSDPGPEPDPGDQPATCASAADRDQAALAAWLAQPLKRCELAAVLPHRAGWVRILGAAGGDPTGWDATAVRAGADGNGVRDFAADGRSFAVFDGFQPLPATATRAEGLDASCAAAVRVTLLDGTCTVSVGDQVIARPLSSSMNVALASWPGGQAPPVAPAPPIGGPRLVDGFQYGGLRLGDDLLAYAVDPRRVSIVAGWLGVAEADARSRLGFEARFGHELFTAPGVDAPPTILGDGIDTIVTPGEAAALATATPRWHYGATGSAWDSWLDVDHGRPRHVGGAPRDTARAASEAAACARIVIGRDLAAIAPATGSYGPPLRTDLDACGHLGVDLAAAIVADDAGRAQVLALYGDAARARYGRHQPDAPVDYEVERERLHEVVGLALIGHDDALPGDPPSMTLDHARSSWTALAPVVAAHPELARRLATAVVERASSHFVQLAWKQAGTPPLTAADAAAIAARIAAAPSPLTAKSVDALVALIADPAAP